MIDHVSGLLMKRDEDYLVVRCGGLGLRLEVPTGAYRDRELGSEVQIPTVFVMRESGVALYGFSSAMEREFFHLLNSISGIGPKTALGILAHAPPSELAQAIVEENLKSLTKVKGIGKKVAQRIVVELSEKIRKLHPKVAKGSGQLQLRGPEDAPAVVEAQEVLLSLGCREEEAQQAIESVLDQVDLDQPEAAEHLVMRALKALGPPS